MEVSYPFVSTAVNHLGTVYRSIILPVGQISMNIYSIVQVYAFHRCSAFTSAVNIRLEKEPRLPLFSY